MFAWSWSLSNKLVLKKQTKKPQTKKPGSVDQKKANVLEAMERLAWTGGGSAVGCCDSPGRSWEEGEPIPTPAVQARPQPQIRGEGGLLLRVCVRASTGPPSLIRTTFQLLRYMGGHTGESGLSQPGGGGIGGCCSLSQEQAAAHAAPWRNPPPSSPSPH